MYGVTRERIRQIETQILSELRQPKRAQLLRNFVTEDLPAIPAHIRARVVDEVPHARPLIHCERHGWRDPGPGPDLSPPRTCAYCPCLVGGGRWPGRPRKYCSDACRQAAYRARTRVHQRQITNHVGETRNEIT
jgi:hypothetical protein